MSGLTQDKTAEPNSRDQTDKQDWQPYRVDVQSAESDDHTHEYTHCIQEAAKDTDCLFVGRGCTAAEGFDGEIDYVAPCLYSLVQVAPSLEESVV